MNEEWITARNALELVRPGCNSFSPWTAEAICRNAAAGRVKAMAENFTITGRGQTASFERREIPQRFWQVTLAKQDWHHGIFISVERGTDLVMTNDWEIRCEALGVRFDRKGIEALNGDNVMVPSSHRNSQVISTKQKRGRPEGSGTYVAADAIIVEKMARWLADRPGTSAMTAAEQFVDEIAGGGTPQTKIRRLAGKYRKSHPN